jgi:type VI protein secretion system component Hcp
MKKTRIRLVSGVGCVAALFFWLGAAWCPAQVTIYAKFLDGTGSWGGPLTNSARVGWVTLKDFSMSFGSPAIFGGATNAATFNPAAFSKEVDRLTPQIFYSIASGAALRNSSLPADMTIEFVKNAGAGPVVFLRIEMKLVLFSSLSNSAAEFDDTVQEQIQLKFGALRLTSWPVLTDGTLGPPVIQSWSQVLGNGNFDVGP